jgi:hypothetical protein
MRRTFIICGATLIWAAALWLDLVPILRGGYGWRWPHDLPAALADLLPLVLATIAYVAGGLWIIRTDKSPILSRQMIAWSVVGSVVLTLAAVYVRDNNVQFALYARTISGGATGWHYAATDIEDLNDTLQGWPDFMDNYVGQSSHMTTSPPGLPLAFYGTTQFFENSPALNDAIAPPLRAAQCHNDRVVGWSLHPGYTNAELSSAWLGMLMPLWGALTVLPLFALARRHFSTDTAVWSIFWWPLVPSFLMFTPNPTPIYAAIALLVMHWTGIALQRRRAIPLLGAGLLMGFGIFLHFTLLPIIFLCGFWTLAYHWQHRAELDRWWSIRAGVWYGIGLSLTWLVYWLTSGVTITDIMQQTFDEHLALDRPYLPWLALHLNDIFMFTGWPLVLLAGVGLFAIGRRWTAETNITLGEWLLIGAAVMLAVMDISGTTQGESGRIWLFVVPFFLIMAAYHLTAAPNSFQRGMLLSVTQGIVLVVMVSTLPVIDSGLTRPPEAPPQIASGPASVVTTEATFEAGVRLIAFGGDVESETLNVWLEWVATEQIETPYYISLLPVAPDGSTPTPATIRQPFEESPYPLTCWTSKDGTIRTFFAIPLDDVNIAPDGAWWVSVSLVSREGQAVSVRNAAGDVDFQVGVGPFR